ncbi:hypothetical protein ACFH04_39485 [Streptomyces noboritoensis]|uniref:Transposase n=1 Tax=Streptomyces noboritoensis TaxID=67337 RepID=A0ABV6TVE3_9ACTN
MRLIQRNPELSAYLASDEVVDHEHPLVRTIAAKLVADRPDGGGAAGLEGPSGVQ